MKLDEFDFDLPRERIADRPARPRDSARLLWVREDSLLDRSVRDLPDLLRPGDVLVLNDTKVIPARLQGKRGEVPVEVTLHMPDAEVSDGRSRWRVFARPGKRLRLGDRVEFASDFSAVVEAKRANGEITLAFDCGASDLGGALDRHGAMPLPPYMRREADALDRSDYQTLHARHPGAVAAPTAGLHFTPELMARLRERAIESVTLTLHVGAGTFLPVKVDDIADHVMHEERGVITEEAAQRINHARAKGGRIVSVGTTALRLLESAADEQGNLRAFSGTTDIFITPGYRFKAIDLLMTNFHLPRSTLFMLVCAFSGMARMKSAYAHAITREYRFYSYGDACLLEPGH